MPGIVRLGDNCSGHDCFPSRPAVEASTDVLVNGKGVVRVGDAFDRHCCGGSCHIGLAASGSSTVLVNGKSVFRQGDDIDCGSKGDECSSDTFA